MDKIKVIYNSQDKNFKKPFGAVEVGQIVKLSIVVNKDLLVALELKDFNNENSLLEMK